MNENKILFLHNEISVEDGTIIQVSLDRNVARAIIDMLISQLINGDMPQFAVYGYVTTEGAYDSRELATRQTAMVNVEDQTP
jgi:hypothetical protein